MGNWYETRRLKVAPVVAIVCGVLSIILGVARDRPLSVWIGVGLLVVVAVCLLVLKINGGPIRWGRDDS